MPPIPPQRSVYSLAHSKSATILFALAGFNTFVKANNEFIIKKMESLMRRGFHTLLLFFYQLVLQVLQQDFFVGLLGTLLATINLTLLLSASLVAARNHLEHRIERM
jgi:hypothetical protein